MPCTFTPSRCHINLEALSRNFKRLGPSESIMPVIKSDAYGHGLLPCAEALGKAGARRFAVGIAAEGVALRQAGLEQEIVPLMGCLTHDDWTMAVAHRLTPLVRNFSDLEIAINAARPLRIAIKCDTGMSRLGFAEEDLPDLIDRLAGAERLEPALLISHLACADMPEQRDFTNSQIGRFENFYKALKPYFPELARSLGNSAAAIALGDNRYECVRPGLALYGGNPFAGTSLSSTADDLEWVMSISSPILQVRDLEPGQSVSYGCSFTAGKSMRIAVAACGYATGVNRNLSNRMSVLLRGQRVPQIGRICMSMLMLDITAIPDAKPGDLAWIIGGEAKYGHKPVDASEIASLLGTIPYEILCLMGSMNPREYNGLDA